jgi:long-chain acyl-CoA synthetase
MYEELRAVWSELTGPGAPFEITEVEVGGRPLKAFKNASPSLREFWLQSSAHGDKDYLVYQDERWTYADAHREVASVAAWLAAQGVGPGDRVAIAMRNFPEWMLAYWATVSIGAAAVGMNAWWTGPEMVYGLQDSDPKVLIADQQRLDVFLPHRGEVGDVRLVGVRLDGERPDDLVEWTALRETAPALPEVEVDPDSDACIFYTSGTTGRPKGAQLTHRGCTNNVMSVAFGSLALAAAARRAKGAETAEPPAPPRSLSALVTTPLFHVTANNCIAHSATLSGGKLVLMYKWDPGAALALIERERITNLSGVPVMARELIAHPDFDRHDTSSLASLGGGGAPLQPDLVKKIDTRVATARPNTGYGMTETCGIITANSADFFVDKPASAGPAMPNYEAKCVDADGKEVARGEVGELWVRGAQVIAGYLNRADATAETITDGWLHTGDIARIDEDGFIFIVDRAKDMVLRGGENVYCAEVETAIFEHDAVAECAVFGVPDDRLGEEVAAAIVVKPGASVTAEALREHCAARLAKYKIPRYMWLLDEPLPRNANGKFLKRQLREELDLAEAV